MEDKTQPGTVHSVAAAVSAHEHKTRQWIKDHPKVPVIHVPTSKGDKNE